MAALMLAGPGVGVTAGESHLEGRVALAETLTVDRREIVTSAIAVGGHLLIRGHVSQDVVAIAGSLEIASGALVEGDALVLGGTLVVHPGAIVRGEQLSLGAPLGELAHRAMDFVRGELSWKALLALTLAASLVGAAVMLVLALLFVSVIPLRVHHVRRYLSAHPVRSALGGVGLLVASVPTFLLLMFTIIGIPLLPLLLIGLLAFPALGLSAVLIWAGDHVPLFARAGGLWRPLLAGAGLFFLVGLVPVAGALLLLLGGVACAGAALLSGFGTVANAGRDRATQLSP
jgi:hypothetical protein